MSNTGYLGGNVSWGERRALIKKHLVHRAFVDLGLRAQCRCGGTAYTRKWKRWYCIGCGRFVRQFPHMEGAA